MRRLYFLVPEQETARKIVDELLLARVEERRIRVITQRGADRRGLPPATIVQMSDVIPALGRGLVCGWIVGLIAGLIAVAAFGLDWNDTGGLLILLISLGGAVFGAWLAGMVGISIPNSRLKQFQQAVDDGRVLMLVDVPAGKIDVFKQSVIKHYPAVQFGGVEPGMPAFP